MPDGPGRASAQVAASSDLPDLPLRSGGLRRSLAATVTIRRAASPPRTTNPERAGENIAERDRIMAERIVTLCRDLGLRYELADESREQMTESLFLRTSSARLVLRLRTCSAVASLVRERAVHDPRRLRPRRGSRPCLRIAQQRAGATPSPR